MLEKCRIRNFFGKLGKNLILPIDNVSNLVYHEYRNKHGDTEKPHSYDGTADSPRFTGLLDRGKGNPEEIRRTGDEEVH